MERCARLTDGGAEMYSHIATGAVAGGIPAVAAASGFAPANLALVVGSSAVAMVGLVGLLRFAHRVAQPHR